MFRFSWLAAVVVAVAVCAAPLSSADACGGCDPCCCAPPPYQTTLDVCPPCSCCPQQVCVCVPGCCTEAPTVCWRKGLFGRQIGTYSWPCCGHEVKVVVTRRGDVKVRG